jgi:hypothetical protein
MPIAPNTLNGAMLAKYFPMSYITSIGGLIRPT